MNRSPAPTDTSPVQIVPQVQKKASHLTAFMRSVTWISPVVGESDLEAEKSKHATQSASEPQDRGGLIKQYWYTEEDKQRFRDDPDYLLAYRRKLESAVNGSFLQCLPAKGLLANALQVYLTCLFVGQTYQRAQTT